MFHALTLWASEPHGGSRDPNVLQILAEGVGVGVGMGCLIIWRTFASLELMCFETLTTTILEIALLRAAGLLENFPSCFSFALGGRIIAETPFKCPGGRDAGI